MGTSRGLVAVGAALLGLVAACNFIVAGTLSDFKPVGPTTFCSFEIDGGYQACGECIQTQCAAELSKSCNVTDINQRKQWFRDLSDCARLPDRMLSSSTPCKEIEDGKTVAPEATGDDADRLRAFNCVRDKCLQPLKVQAACRICALTRAPTTGTTPIRLSDTPCGQCLERNCANQIVEYCNTSQDEAIDGAVKAVGTKTLLDCVSPVLEDRASCITALQTPPPLGADAGSSAQRDIALRTCGKTCIAPGQCQ